MSLSPQQAATRAPAARDVDAAPVAWREAGRGDTVLFLHGLGGSRIAWEPQLAALAGRYRCVAWDMPGYGASAALAGEHSFDALADAVAGLLDTLGVARAHVVGLSLGGMVAQHAALAHPRRVASLVLLDSSPAFGLDGETTAERWLEARLEPLRRGVSPAELAPAVLRAVAGPRAPDAVIEEAARAMARIPAEGLAAACRCLVTHDLRGRLAAIEAPTLVAVGALDTETPPAYAERLAAEIPAARLEIVPEAGHLANLEQPGRVNALLAGFLDGQPRIARSTAP
jgi:3-oxoadipate enol-lactonase